MLHRSREKNSTAEGSSKSEAHQDHTILPGQEVTTSTNTGGDDATRSIRFPLEGNSDTGSRNTISRPLNDLLPPEILIQIFEILILDVWASYSITPILSRVCRSWYSVAQEIQLCKTLITGSKGMDIILDYIHTTSRYKQNGTAGIRDLAVQTDHLKDFHRLPELLDLCRSSLQVLSLDRFLYKGEDLCPLLVDEPETGGNFYLPSLKALTLTRLRSTELIFLLTSVDPAKLWSLRLCDTPFPSEDKAHADISSIQFPHMQEITVQGSQKEHDPNLPNLCRVAPTLETLDVSIGRGGFQKLMNFLASDHVPNSLKMLKIWIEMESYNGFNWESPDLNPLVDLIEKRGWKNRIYMNNSSRAWCVLC
ncbi:hypothetical protein FRC04_004636 [Tulasnella sp. 424]|nr:hypothetical protein FRC04_004636 [Tulasnella sp. 424]KAG8963939.1 hypothetical protein FRC05_004341 [Tulasnella sp. 425]